jgi:hypothetical protein
MTDPISRPQLQITSLDDLKSIYGEPSQTSLDKEVGLITPEYRQFIEAAPFLTLSTVADEGLDCSPRGDPPGFVRVVDEKTVQIPDRRGNNRTDSLRNFVRDPRVSLMFLIPGVGEAIRINGQAKIFVDPALLGSFAINNKAPRSVIEVTVDSIYFQCQKALHRSRLWDPEAIVDRSSLPTAGQIAQSLSSEPFDGEAYDAAYPERMAQTIY